MTEQPEKRSALSRRRAALGAFATTAVTTAAAGLTLATGEERARATEEESRTGAGRGQHGRDGQQVRGTFTVTDRRGRQRFLASPRKPPIIIDGQELPPEKRSGPDNATYLILNDGSGNEKGGIVGFDAGASVSLDYPGAQGATLYTDSRVGDDGERTGFAALSLVAPPPKPDARSAERVVLAGGNSGASVQLNDSQGRPRIQIGIGADDEPVIRILDASGEETARFPS